MTRNIYIFIACLLVSVTTGCRKYVEIDQQGIRSLHYTSDYQYILNNLTNMEPVYTYPVLASDDIEITDEGFQQRMNDKLSRAYTWAEKIFGDESDSDWDLLYKQIYICNETIDGVMTSDGGTDAQKRMILAEARVHRAYAYFNLVNVYAKQYDAATAATDPGVPMLLKPDLFAKLNRASVQSVYDQIKLDLELSVADLPELPDVPSNPSRTAAYAILAKTSLQKEEYADAGKFADSALVRQHALLDLKSYIAAPGSMPLKLKDPETILSKVLSLSSVFPLSAGLLKLYDTTDLRYKLFTANGSQFTFNSFVGRGYYRPYLNYQGSPVGPNVPEMMLIKAESEARTGTFPVAVTILNTLRTNRFRTVDYSDLSAANADEALKLVIDERRRELLCRGIRWFDQKRLNKEQAFAKTITRTFLGETFSLAPGANRYVFPIADKNIQLNPEIEQNPR
ncbi:SusD family protein [Chitinophaga sp. CF118]|uniref:RagB/SusD family nutrient uptake outer membrane protein n=1 Tax=Chitinophaga sp. CF118 TaxID=1884367 RepID=UPI0008E2AB26|nr:RagB/SusD family nutrient uptake outer membrane protein [Chitinophaga sp. CF118]SFD46702.1 SusD family protein [Chitinophaga sp. CF118]